MIFSCYTFSIMSLNEVISKRKNLYKALLDLHYQAHLGHIGSSLSVLDILAYIWLYKKGKEDKMILSKGHAAPALYTVLHELGYIEKEDIDGFHKNGTKLGVHPSQYHYKNDVPFATGSLGHGLSLSVGIAQGYLLQQKKHKVYCVMSDGECNEGQVWEAAQYASSKKIHNLYVFIDKNGIQAFGKTKDVLGDGASIKKWEAFGFDVAECNGHDLQDIDNTIKKLEKNGTKNPKLIICNTIKGNGVSFMENTIEWHYNALDEVSYGKAIQDIESKI